jgi:hypothetical protein
MTARMEIFLACRFVVLMVSNTIPINICKCIDAKGFPIDTNFCGVEKSTEKESSVTTSKPAVERREKRTFSETHVEALSSVRHAASTLENIIDT